MKRIHKVRLFVLINLIVWTTAALSQNHPRLLFGSEEIPALQDKMNREPFTSMLQWIQSDADSATDWVSDYDKDQVAVNAAFMYMLTGDTAYSNKAKANITDVINGNQWAREDVKGLRLYMHGKAVAQIYDLCYTAWDSTFNAWVSSELKRHADVIYTHGGTEQNQNDASNWQGIRFSSAGFCYLACDEEINARTYAGLIQGCYDKVVLYCKENMGNDPLSRGWNIEGIGYTTYPFGQFIGAYGIAMARYDSMRSLKNEMESVRWTPWTIYASGCRIENMDGYGLHPDFGDDNGNLRGEGTFGLAFHYCHAELIPGLKYWYDRLVGALGDGSFDHVRHGAIYGYLYYPDEVIEQDPMTISKWMDGFIDVGGNGYLTYRNQYKDSTDLVAQMYMKLRGNKGHSGPDALTFRILGFDTPWAVGGGRYGPKINGHHAYYSSMNTLYPVDPESADLKTNGNSGTIVGTPYLKEDGSGHVISEIEINNVNVHDHKRWFIADYSENTGAEAVYIIGDKSATGTYWQLCTLESQSVTLNETEKTFLIQGSNGSSMKGWILYQKGNHYLTTGKRIRGSGYGYKGVNYDENNYVHFGSDDADYLVALTIVPQGATHPKPVLNGRWPGDVTVHVGDLQVNIFEDEITYGNTDVLALHESGIDPEFYLITNYPNPFNTVTTIRYLVTKPGRVKIAIYNVNGRKIRDLENTIQSIGEYTVRWDGRDFRDNYAPSGIYVFRLEASDKVETHKMILMK